VFKFTFLVKAIPRDRQRYSYQKTIRDYLKVKQYDKAGQRLIAALVAEATEVKKTIRLI